MPPTSIIIAGAGPSGLLLALLLARHPSPDPITITLFDAAHGLDPRPRAAYYGPAAVPVLARAGILPDVRSRGYSPRWMTWKKLWTKHPSSSSSSSSSSNNKNDNNDNNGGVGGAELLGRIDLDSGPADRTACLALDELGALLVEHLERVGAEAEEKRPGAVRLVWGARVVGVGQGGEEEGKAWVDVEFEEEGAEEGEDGKKEEEEKKKKRVERRYADYVVGCDGASSAVRRSLFGEKEKGFPGRTWEEQIVAANVYYDFTRWGYTDVQFFIHPEHWHMVARLAGPPNEYWRVSYGERSGLTHEQLLERQPAKFAAMLPGHPQPGDYELAGFSPYRVHQRLAPSMRVGRIVLAADAAHLCNPFGGLGLTGGIVDVGGLYDCLAGIHDGLADEAILDVYSDVRRRMWTDVVDPVSSDNIRRLFGQDPDLAAEKDDFIKLINVAEKDEKVRDELRAGLHAIQYDFKQHYRNAQPSPPTAAAESDEAELGSGSRAGGSGVGVAVTAASN
ncbi:fad binding domain-containing protein [Diplodia corticola]|uniref:Fad binding domain-containing protein n=1 Tax=Diplodia corticola TaxID=236234 RepID=A0A1J9RCD1_9PEZI|nr:fad binding domain-containing protein [Diplodia corticola]OJD38121.1 fad binding domain-containing protein [Diplodia corticola]